jgi:hypothetical protein
MRAVDYLKAIGIALGFITAAQSPSVASTYIPSSIGGRDEGLRDNDHYIRFGDNEHDRELSIAAKGSSFSENNPRKVSIETAIVGSLLDGSRRLSDQGDHHPAANLLSEGILLDAGPETARVSATPLPAALPLFAGGMGVLGFLVRRRKTNATRPRRG